MRDPSLLYTLTETKAVTILVDVCYVRILRFGCPCHKNTEAEKGHSIPTRTCTLRFFYPSMWSLNALVQTQRLHMHPPVITYPDHSFTQQIHSVRYSWSGQTNLGRACHHQPPKSDNSWSTLPLFDYHGPTFFSHVINYWLLSLSLTPSGPIQHELWNLLHAMAIINSWRMQGIFGPASESEHTTTVSADPS